MLCRPYEYHENWNFSVRNVQSTNAVEYESHDRAAPGGAAAPKNAAPEIYFSLLEAQRGIIPIFFLLYQLQIVLLTIANKKNISFPEIMIL